MGVIEIKRVHLNLLSLAVFLKHEVDSERSFSPEGIKTSLCT